MNADIDGNNLVLSAKSSLIKYVQQIPADISQIQPNSVLHVSVCFKHIQTASHSFIDI